MLLEEIREAGQAVATWVPILSLVGVAIGFFILRRYRLQQLQLAAQQYLSELALNVKITPRVFAQCGYWFLELNVEVSNPSNKTWCIPAVYVSARALVDKNRIEDQDGMEDYKGTTNFDDLPECQALSTPLNRGYLPDSIFQVGPGETEQFVRWDRLDRRFVERFPVVVVSAEVFGAEVDLLGERHTPAVTRGRYRTRWLEFMTNRVERGDCSIVFARCPPGCKEPLNAGERYIQVSQDGKQTYDLESSREFRDILDTVVQWSRQATVDIMGAAGRSAGSPGSSSPSPSNATPPASLSPPAQSCTTI